MGIPLVVDGRDSSRPAPSLTAMLHVKVLGCGAIGALNFPLALSHRGKLRPLGGRSKRNEGEEIRLPRPLHTEPGQSIQLPS